MLISVTYFSVNISYSQYHIFQLQLQLT